MSKDDRPFVEGIRQGRRPNKAKINLAEAFGEKVKIKEVPPEVKTEGSEAVSNQDAASTFSNPARRPYKPRGKMTRAEEKARRQKQGATMRATWARRKAEKAAAEVPIPPEQMKTTVDMPEAKDKAAKKRFNPESLKNLRGVQGNKKGGGMGPATKAMQHDLKDVWQWMQSGRKTSLKAQAKKDPRWFYELVKGCFPKDVFVQQTMDVSKMSEQQINDEIVKLLQAHGVGVENKNTYNKGTESEIDRQVSELLTESQGEVKH